MELHTQDDDVVTRQAAEHLAEVLPGDFDLREIRAAVRAEVRELRSSRRVQTFVGIFAARNAREVLLRSDRTGGDRTSA